MKTFLILGRTRNIDIQPNMKTIIHVNKLKIAQNNKHRLNQPAIAVRVGNGVQYCHRCEIIDDNGNVIGEFIQEQNDPQPFGAKVWLELDSKNVRIK